MSRPMLIGVSRARRVRAMLCSTGLGLCIASSVGATAHAAVIARHVDQNSIIANAATGKEWPMAGMDYAGTRFSPLIQINADNVKRLGLAWTYNLESTRGVEATPVVVDGVMYVTAPWSVVHAIDVRSGKRLWVYDPKVPRSGGSNACCDVVNRGVAVEKGKVFVGSLDGRLVAIDATTGKRIWEQDTIIDRTHRYTITGAPRIFNGKVIIGNGGAELGVRGYITAYDEKTGAQKWRWFAVPGDPSKPFEDESMEKAAKTWDPSAKYWENGGGGTVWNSMVFDPELNLMYIGTGNGGPWTEAKRSPAGGDNLYLASIVALNPDTGKYVWHYQETPGDNWDYTSAQDLILADITLDGASRKVILHAPKNGFFFVIDRTTGAFISADKFVDVNWATGYDKNGRPIEIPAARYSDKPYDISPGPFGGHNWQPMSYSPITGLAYFPAQHIPITLAQDKQWGGHDSNKPGEVMSQLGWNTGDSINAEPASSKPFGRLIAWDPVQQKQAWSSEFVSPWNGGTLATAGNLVFEGTADARFLAFNAKTGEKLWDSATGTGVVAAPMTYEIDGKQYVTVAAGWGGVYALGAGPNETTTTGTVYTFVLDGKAPLPAFAKTQQTSLLAGVKYDPKDVAAGTQLYISGCAFCHGVPAVAKGGNIPNLGYVDKSIIENLDKFVFNGPFVQQGMPDFTGKLTPDDVEKIKAFIQGTADAVRPTATQ